MQHTRKQFLIYIYMYICQIALKKLFLYNKKNSDLKINMPKNHKSLSLSSIFLRKKKGLAG